MTIEEQLHRAQQRGYRLVSLRQSPLGNWQVAYAVGSIIYPMCECMTPADALGEAYKLVTERHKDEAAPAALSVFD